MTESRRIVWLILIMMAAVTVSTAAAIRVLYGTAFDQARGYLIQSVIDQAHLIEAVARFNRLSHPDDPAAAEDATLAQIQGAYAHLTGGGQQAEIAIAQRDGDRIVYRLIHGPVRPRLVESIPFESPLGEPMRLALAGGSGAMIGLDYRGARVLAAYTTVPMFNTGVVAKIDLAAIRAPFLRAGVMVIGLAALLVSLGAVLFVRLTNPLVEHLTETEHRYQRIFSSAPVPIWEEDFSAVITALNSIRASGVSDLGQYLVDNPGALHQLAGGIRVLEANAAALDLFGAGETRELADWFEGIFIPSTLELSTDKLQAIWSGREVLLNPGVTVKTLAGRELTVRLSMVTPGPNDARHSVPVSALDITADVNLQRREEELGLIMASTGEGIYGMDRAGRCTFVNRAALGMLGYRDESELLGREMHSLIHHTRSNGTQPGGFAGLVASCPEDERLWRADGTSFPADYRSYPMLRDGTTLGTVVTFTDITERKEKEAQLLQVQKMETVGQLTGGLAHDFNNLLTIILGNLKFLKLALKNDGDPEVAELLTDAQSAAQDGAALTRRLLAFSRRLPLEPQWIDLDILIEHTGRFLRRLMDEGIKLIVRRNGGPLPVRVDRQQLEHAIINLAINGRDAMPDGGTLVIDTGRQELGADPSTSRVGLSPGSYVVIRVSDTGVGMSPEVARRAVEPFYSTKPMGKGSGLGLSTALGFAQQSGGDLTISSVPGRGTTVSLYLPEAASEPSEQREAEPVPVSPNVQPAPATILVAEDEWRTRRLARRTLSELGYRVLEAKNAAAAVRVLEQDDKVDLLFADVVMPGELSGRDLGHWVREHLPGVRVLLTSGHAQHDDGEPLPFLKKPYSKDQLEEAVQALLVA